MDPRTPVVRSPLPDEGASTPTIRQPLRALFFSATPREQSPVGVESEQMRLSLALGTFKQRQQIPDTEITHCTTDDLKEALEHQDFDFVYYTGHGTYRDGQGYLCLEKDNGETDFLSASRFARMLNAQSRPPSVLFLNCCLSGAADPTSDGERFLDGI